MLFNYTNVIYIKVFIRVKEHIYMFYLRLCFYVIVMSAFFCKTILSVLGFLRVSELPLPFPSAGRDSWIWIVTRNNYIKLEYVGFSYCKLDRNLEKIS